MGARDRHTKEGSKLKVSDLIETLEALPQGADVLLSADAEGNSYSPCDGYELGYIYKSEAGYRTDDLLSDESLEDWTSTEIQEDLERVVVLWPV